jgi:hypothetical protein
MKNPDSAPTQIPPEQSRGNNIKRMRLRNDELKRTIINLERIIDIHRRRITVLEAEASDKT